MPPSWIARARRFRLLECTLTNQATAAVLTVKSDSQGSCVFNIIQAGSYSFTAQAKGFKALSVKDITVDAGAIRTLGNLTLEVGAITESVQVTGEVSQINLASAEKAGTISMTQLQNVAVKGRDMFAYMITIPGVVDNMSQARETTSPDSLRGTFINGSRENSKNYAVDGITNLDTGSNNTLQFEPNMDSIAEVKVMTSNFQAEYGRNGGGVITVITRGGGRDFHVSAYDTYRNEELNANSFWNNRTNVAKAPYRYRITGYTVGGPVFIPKVFNTKRTNCSSGTRSTRDRRKITERASPPCRPRRNVPAISPRASPVPALRSRSPTRPILACNFPATSSPRAVSARSASPC